MRIAFRRSGGRGEYELAGKQGDIDVSKVLGKPILFELTPEIVIASKTHAEIESGKPRIRTEQGGAHVQKIFSSILLMPDPIRVIRGEPGNEAILKTKAYAITIVDIDIVDTGRRSILLRPTQIMVESGDRRRVLVFTERMARVFKVWSAAVASS